MFDIIIVRAAAWFVLVLCLVALWVILDIWRSRNSVQASDIAVMIVLSVSVLACTGVFARCAWTGVFPCVKETSR